MRGIYVASKTYHALMWRDLRDNGKMPIVSTWIDEADPKASDSLPDLWVRCVREAAHADALVFYQAEGDVPKGALLEVGAALASGVPVLVAISNVSLTGGFWNHPGVTRYATLAHALSAALCIVNGDRS